MQNYFTEEELSCPCCSENKFNKDTLGKFNAIRNEAGFSMNMTSGYRCEAYNKRKGYTQTHATGQAGDIQCSHKQALSLVQLALKHGMTGIGVSQKGDVKSRFIHMDDLDEIIGRPRPHIWSY
jgi:zinc D-Ala-D-Ala carboxypeptidase